MEEKDMINLLRRIRHDFGNHLQVIMGYIDLGEPAEARKYLSEINERLGAERIIFENASAGLSLYLYQQKVLSQDLGVVLQYDAIEMESADILVKAGEPLASLKKMLERMPVECLEEEPVVYLEIYARPDGIDMIYSCDQLVEGSVMVEIRE